MSDMKGKYLSRILNFLSNTDAKLIEKWENSYKDLKYLFPSFNHSAKNREKILMKEVSYKKI